MRKMFVLALALCATVASAEELAVGAGAPPFSLVNSVDGKTYSFKPGDGKTSVIVFTCNSCPYSVAFENRLASLGSEYGSKGIVFYAINPNDDNAYPAETLDKMKARAADKRFPFPYLKDGNSAVARAYGARVTPHVFVVDGTGKVRYRGYVDDSARKDEVEHTGLKDALDSLLSGADIAKTSTRAFGCTIKWSRKAAM